jgi:uncharacterized membrane protein
MSADTRQARGDYSRGFSALSGPVGALTPLRVLLAIAGLAGAILLVIATFATVIHITVVTVTKAHYSGWHFTGPGLVLIGLFALPLLAGALRGSRPAAIALACLGAVALILVLALVQPKIHDTGVYGQDYDQAAAGASFGYYAETAGAVLVLLAGVGLVVLGGTGRPRRRASLPDAEEAPAAAGVHDADAARRD